MPPPEALYEIHPQKNHPWESAKVSHKRVFALLTPEKPQPETAKMLQKPVFALPGCQPISVNTLLCDTLGLAEPTQIKALLTQTISGQFVQTVPSFPLKISRNQAERVCTNCLCKLFFFWWVFFWVGRFPLKHGRPG